MEYLRYNSGMSEEYQWNVRGKTSEMSEVYQWNIRGILVEYKR